MHIELGLCNVTKPKHSGLHDSWISNIQTPIKFLFAGQFWQNLYQNVWLVKLYPVSHTIFLHCIYLELWLLWLFPISYCDTNVLYLGKVIQYCKKRNFKGGNPFKNVLPPFQKGVYFREAKPIFPKLDKLKVIMVLLNYKFHFCLQQFQACLRAYTKTWSGARLWSGALEWTGFWSDFLSMLGLAKVTRGPRWHSV